MLVNLKEMLEDAKVNKYAVPQFNINNLEWTRFILEECNKNNSPVILGVSESAIKYMGGCKTVADLVNNLVTHLKITVPVVLHLDHGSTLLICKDAICSGFTSVMIDASKYDLSENIRITSEVVAYSKNHNVTVEGEVGHVGSDNNIEILCAEVDDCVQFCKETKVDFLAPALGSVHGLYKGEPNLDFERMKEIANKTNLPLVLHGGTGIYDKQIKCAIKCGITKININTELQIAWSKAVREFLNNNKNVYDPRKIIKSGECAIKECVRNKIYLFGSNDRYNTI